MEITATNATVMLERIKRGVVYTISYTTLLGLTEPGRARSPCVRLPPALSEGGEKRPAGSWVASALQSGRASEPSPIARYAGRYLLDRKLGQTVINPTNQEFTGFQTDRKHAISVICAYLLSMKCDVFVNC